MIPVGGGRGAVMFGQSVRGQGNALELLIDPAAPADEFADDWTAVHELSHLMHPYLGDRGAWLAEGLATYYQNVLRARSGLLTPAQGWDRLFQGFQRGAKARSDETLDEVAQNMHRSHAFQRVYWAGAAYWLTVDRDLRRDSGGAMNLETALSRFRDCCLPAYRQWQPEDFVARLDKLAGSAVFTTRYREFAGMREFPDWAKVYADLGIRTDGEHLAFDAKARDAAIRDAIMAAPPGNAGAPAAAR
jgi:predicted metalloprotease with PDZ domain